MTKVGSFHIVLFIGLLFRFLSLHKRALRTKGEECAAHHACCLLIDHHEYLGFVWDYGYRQDCICYLKQGSIVLHRGTYLVFVPCYKKDHGNLQGIFKIPSGHHQRDAEATRWAENVVFKYVQTKVSVYYRISSIFLVFHSTSWSLWQSRE